VDEIWRHGALVVTAVRMILTLLILPMLLTDASDKDDDGMT
jgi:hypothetical protein